MSSTSSFGQNPLIATVLHKRNLNAALKELSASDLKSVILKLNEALVIKEEDERQQELAMAERNETLKHIQDLLAEHNLTPDDLTASVAGKKAKVVKPPLPPKYKYTCEDGKVVTWSGAGRKPTAIKEAIENGKSLEDMLI